MTWDGVMTELNEKRFALEDEEKALTDQLKSVEEQAKIQEEHAELLKARLVALNEKISAQPPQRTRPGIPPGFARRFAPGIPPGVGPGVGPGVSPGVSPGIPPEIPPRFTSESTPRMDGAGDLLKGYRMIADSADMMVVLTGKDGSAGAGFLAQQEGKTRIFVSAQWLDRNPRPSVARLDGSPIPIGEGLGCPVGVELVCLQPQATDLPYFELAADDEKPAVGSRFVVLRVDPKTKRVDHISGSIRGIGPDTLELDADLKPEMTGAPVLDMKSGRVIGIVAPQIAGVADEWAIGTRHQGNRNFAARIDRIREWKTSDLGRFANEAAYVEGINQTTRIAWLAHMLLADNLDSAVYRPGVSSNKTDDESTAEYERRRKTEAEEDERRRQFVATVKKEARENAANPHIVRVRSWLNESPTVRREQGDRLQSIYRSILTDLKKQEPDLSSHMTWHHQQQYRIALGNRSEGIRVIGKNANHVGN